MSKVVDKKVKIVRSFFKKEQPKNHPIKNHPLEKCEEYVKNLYIDMLCVFAMYDNDDTENQNRFIERIIYGVEDTLSIADHIKRAMEITVDKVGEFIKQIEDNDIKDIFFIDALIISCANGSPTKKQTEFLAEFADMLNFTKENISFFSKLVISILEGNSDKFNECANEYKDIRKYIDDAKCYIDMVIDKILLSFDRDIIYRLKSKDKIEKLAEGYQFRNLDSVTLENIIVDKNISFSGVKTVIFNGCTFARIDGINFNGVERVIIDNCVFKNMRWVLAFNSRGTIADIKNSSFEDCYGYYEDDAVIIHSRNNNNIEFYNDIFRNIKNTYDRLRSERVAISIGNNIKTYNCEFYDCATWLFTYGKYSDVGNKYVGCDYVTYYCNR